MINNIRQEYRTLPFAVLLLIGLYLSQGIFGLLHFSRVLFIVFFLGFMWGYKKDTPFSTPLMLLMVSMVLSMFSCMIFHDQGFVSSMGGYVTFAAISIFFVLRKLNIAPWQIEKVLFWMFVIFCLCYIYQILVFPKLVFISSDEHINYEVSISLRRIRMNGMSLAGFGAFFSLNKILSGKKIFIIPLALAIVVILLFGFRTLTFFVFVFSFVMVARIYKLSFKLIFGFSFMMVVLWAFSITEFGQETFGAMMERQETDQTFANKDYVRYATLFYYYRDHFQNVFEMFLGSGIPARDTGSAYEIYYNRLEAIGLHYYDWGLLGMSWMMGMLSLVGMLWYPIRAFFARLPKDKLYLSVWFGYLLCCAFTSAEFVRPGCFLLQGGVLYLITKYEYEKDYNNK